MKSEYFHCQHIDRDALFAETFPSGLLKISIGNAFSSESVFLDALQIDSLIEFLNKVQAEREKKVNDA
jgi:hypothetical protein